MAAIMLAEEFRKIILRNHYLHPCGIGSEGFSYIPINRETFERLKDSSAFTKEQIKTLESRVIN